jgi:ribosome-binding factor A
MAQGRRVERMAALIRREVSEMLINGIKDERVHNGMVSITHADVAGDLQHCRIFVSVLGTDEDRQLVLAGLMAAAPYVKGELGRRLKMRRTPEVVFLLDKGLERGTSVLGLLGRLETERLSRGEIPEGSDVAPSGPTPADPEGLEADPEREAGVGQDGADLSDGDGD